MVQIYKMILYRLTTIHARRSRDYNIIDYLMFSPGVSSFLLV